MKRGFLGLMMVGLFALGPFACTGGEASCVDLCEEAQERSCTAISGSCTSFCEAAFNVEEESGCADEREAYQDCLEGEEVCADSCDSLESSFSNCLGNYCLTRTSDPDCQTLINSF